MNLSLCGTSTDINVNVVSCTDITHIAHGNELKVKIILRKVGRSCHTFFFHNVLWRSEVFHFTIICHVNNRLAYQRYDFIIFNIMP